MAGRTSPRSRCPSRWSPRTRKPVKRRRSRASDVVQNGSFNRERSRNHNRQIRRNLDGCTYYVHGRMLSSNPTTTGEQKKAELRAPLLARKLSSGSFDVFLSASLLGIEVSGGNDHGFVESLDAERQGGRCVAETEHRRQTCGGERLKDVAL